ncbi:MAG: hypothetical protein GY699_21300 [Desulfobacteraceae bacterium]|nr:hypothetical protein [Desulfobacteraceae bacterium]
MKDTKDIRDQTYLSGSEVQNLNFIKESESYMFRKYYRSGLRSHIFEVLLIKDVHKESQGEIIDGIRLFPRAKPKKIFRILRSRFESKDTIFNEIKKYNILLNALGPDLIAQSQEFVVEYTGTGTRQIVLCGLQEYVEGEILDPWRIFDENYLTNIYQSTPQRESNHCKLAQTAKKNIATFVKKIHIMIKETGYIPDLAGNGNLILTPDGGLKLVDINNIVEIKLDNKILIDDKGYPSCDVSIDVLSILERDILQKDIHIDDPIYKVFLTPKRKKRVKALEKKFYNSLS